MSTKGRQMNGQAVLFSYPNSCEINHIKASEILKRRQIRLMQVRRMSKAHFALARSLHREKERSNLSDKNRNLQRQKILEDFALLQNKQNALNDIMESFGCGHRNAFSWKDPGIEERKRLSTMGIAAKRRFAAAYADLMVTRAQSLREAETRRHLRESTRAAERARAAAVAALPPPSRDPLDPHLNPNGGPCAQCLKSSCVAEVADNAALANAMVGTERANLSHQRAPCITAEAALESRVREQLALKSHHAMRTYGSQTQQMDAVPVGGVEIGRNIYVHEVPPFMERPQTISPDAVHMSDAHCTAPVHSSPDLTDLGPGECVDSPSVPLSPFHSSIAHPRSSSHPTSDSSQTLIFHKRPPILPLSAENSCFNSHTSVSKTCPSDSFGQTGLHSTGTDASNSFKPLDVRLYRNELPALESCDISGMDNRRPSPIVLGGNTYFDHIKLQLDSEVESIDKAIQKLRESFNIGVLSNQSAQDNEVNLTQICSPSSSISATSPSQSPSKIIEVIERPETAMVTGMEKGSAMYHVKPPPSDCISDVIGVAMGKEKQLLGTAAPTASLSFAPVPCPTSKTSASAVAELGTGARSFSVKDSLQRRARELILRQMEFIRPSTVGIRTSVCRMLERPLHPSMELAHVDGADLQGPPAPAETRVSSSVRLSHHLNDATSLTLSTPPLIPCQSLTQPMISSVPGSFSNLQRLSSPNSSLSSLPSSCTKASSASASVAEADRVTVSSKISHTSACLPALKDADNDVDLFTGTIKDFVATKRELLRGYLKRLLRTVHTKSNILPSNCNGTYLPSMSTFKIHPINALISKSAEQMPIVWHDQSNNNFRPQCTSSSYENLYLNPRERLKENIFNHHYRSWPDFGLLQECFGHRFGEPDEISKPINHSVHDSASTLNTKEYSVCHLNSDNSGAVSPFILSSRHITSPSSDLGMSCDSSSGRSMNQFSALSFQTLPMSPTSTATRKSFQSPASMRRRFTIVKSASVALETPLQSLPSKHSPTEECIVCNSSTAYQDGKIVAVEAHSDADLTQVSVQDQLANKTAVPGAQSQSRNDESAVFSCAARALSTNLSNVPIFSTALDATCGITSSSSFSKPTPAYLTSPPSSARNCIWFQKTKYNLQSIPTGLEDKMNPQMIFNASMLTDSTVTSSSRPSNQFSYLSSQSSSLPAEPPFVSDPEASQGLVSCKPVTQSQTSTRSTTTTLHALQSGLSIGFGNGFEKSHAQPSCDFSVGTLNVVKGEEHASTSTLTRLRSGVMTDEASSPLCSDVPSILTINNNASAPRQSDGFMGEKKEPSLIALLDNRSFRTNPPFKIGTSLHPSNSPSLELDPCSSTRLGLKQVSHCVGASPVSTFICLKSDPIPPTPISGISRNLTLLTRPNLAELSKSLPIVNIFDDVEQIGTDSNMSVPPLENPTFYSLMACCNAAGSRVTPSCNSNSLPEPIDGKCGPNPRNQSTETCCEASNSINMSSSPSVSLHSFLENEARAESSVEQKRNGEGIFSLRGTLTVQTHSLNTPPSGGTSHQTRRSSYPPLVASRAPLISVMFEPSLMNCILEESETVVQTLPSADQMEENEVTSASALAALPDGKAEGGNSTFSESFNSKGISNDASPTMSVGSKLANAKASKSVVDNERADSVKSVTAQADTRNVNNINAIIFDLIDGKISGKEVGTVEKLSVESVDANADSEGAAMAIARKQVHARPVEVRPAITGSKGVEDGDRSTGTVAAISAKAVDVRGADAEPHVRGTAAAPTGVKIVGPISLGEKAFAATSVDATTIPAIVLSDMKKAATKAAMRGSLTSRSCTAKPTSVPSVGVTSEFVVSLSAEAGSKTARPSDSTGGKMVGTKSVGKGAFGGATLSAMNFNEKKVPANFITAEVKCESVVKLADLKKAGIQTPSRKATHQNGAPLEISAQSISVANSNPLESYIALSEAPKVNGPHLLAANSASAALTGIKVTDIERSVGDVVPHQPNGTVIYSVAAPAGLPTYFTTDTAATIARMRKVQEELQRKGSDPLPNPERRLLVGLQDELAVPLAGLSSTRSPNYNEASSPVQVMLSTLNHDQRERNGMSPPRKSSHPGNFTKSRCSSRFHKPSETIEDG